MTYKTQIIRINDILQELSEENARLSSELLCANKCVEILWKFKNYFYDNYLNKKTTINTNYDSIVDNQLKELENELKDILSSRNTTNSENNSNESVANCERNNNFDCNQSKQMAKQLRKPKLNLEEKCKLINAIENRGDQKKKEIAQRFNISLSYLSIIYKEKDKWINSYDDFKDNNCHSMVNNIVDDKTLKEKCEIKAKVLNKRRNEPKDKHMTDNTNKVYTKTPKKSTIKAKRFKNRYKHLKCDWMGCDYFAGSRVKLLFHKNKHLGVKPFTCAIVDCGKAFYGKYSLNKHIEFVHRLKKTLSCQWPGCEMMFKKISGLNAHMKYHSIPYNQRPYACDRCAFRSLNKPSLEIHKTVHSNERLFKCSAIDCGKTFKTELILKSHMRTHSSVTYLKCNWPQCNRLYRSKSSYYTHRLSHTNALAPNGHPCDWPGCDYRAYRPELLRNHRVRHTNERNFPCTWPSCDKKLKSRKNLSDHLRIHMNDKRHKCQWPGCDYSCIQSSNLKKHFKIHCK